MTKVYIHYFSGTGNTKRAVDVISEDLKKHNFEVKKLVIGKDKLVNLDNEALHIFAFSILSWSAPVLVQKYLRRLAPGRGAKAAAFAVYAGDPGQALVDAQKILRNRQFDVFLSGGACYPNNWSQMTNPVPADEAKDVLAAGDQTALDFSNSFIKGEAKQHPSFASGHSLTRIIAFFFALFGRRFLGKMYIADSGCNRCELCIRTCPVHTIKLSGVISKKPHWGFNCEDCARCINICPRKAIQVSIPRLALHSLFLIGLIIACFPLAGSVAQFLPESYRMGGWVAALIILFGIALWLQFIIIDRLFFVVEQIPGLKRFFEKSYTKNYNRYIAPGFKP
jgi:Pyruvate/2-oxoacid:ferredoxin oxidoreductase delta subunit